MKMVTEDVFLGLTWVFSDRVGEGGIPSIFVHTAGGSIDNKDNCTLEDTAGERLSRFCYCYTARS